VARVRPDLVITYDPAGLYCHDDHVVCTEVLTELLETGFPHEALWYVALPRRLHAWVPLDESLKARRPAPTHKVFIGAHLLAKTRALLARALRLDLRQLAPACSRSAYSFPAV